MEVTNLYAHPDKYKDTIDLIERSFAYQSPNKFDVDFYPLVSKDNHSNCWIILDDNKVAAHSASINKEIKIKDKTHNIVFIGGVAVDQNHRGKGLSKTLLNKIFTEHTETSLFVLWSDKVDFYKKQNFYPAVELFEIPQIEGESSFKKVDWANIENLYTNQNEYRISRNKNDWEEIKKITSTDMYIKESDGKIVNYFFMNKGQDLTGVIHEYGNLEDMSEILTHGKLWSSTPAPNAQALFGSLIKIGNQHNFKELILGLTNYKIHISSIGELISFSFDSKEFELSMEEFIQGVFGPGRFEELSTQPKLFISGLDSI